MSEEFDIDAVYLPKWPALAVKGDPVSRDRAAEIIVRTDSWMFCGNDRAFEAELCRAAGIGFEGGQFKWEDIDPARVRYRVVEDLEYLVNAQIYSAWIGGPHGWCNWDGAIGCGHFNIGKRPSAAGVLAEWRAIAAAFPDLDLTAQLFSGETCEECIRPLIEYRVHAGTAEAGPPGVALPLHDYEIGDVVRGLLFDRNRERGCTIETFKKALAMAESRS